MQSNQKIFYRRRLPHYQPPNEAFHVTFRLTGSLAHGTILRLKHEHDEIKKGIQKAESVDEQRRLRSEWGATYFKRFDELLDMATEGTFWLQNPAVADLVSAAIHFRDTKVYDLLTFCIMPNHVHMLFGVERSDTSLYRLLQSLKAYTARGSNALLGRTGPFWQHESYDHVVRDEAELERTIWHILQNPVKAGLCKDWLDWKWSYLRDGLVEL